jgi:hypothetical protein
MWNEFDNLKHEFKEILVFGVQIFNHETKIKMDSIGIGNFPIFEKQKSHLLRWLSESL